MKLMILLIPLLLLTPTIAHAITPYQSGYKHGLSDNLTYLIQPGKGFAFHTKEFNQGFIDGFCSLPGNRGQYTGSDADEGTFNCVADVSSAAKNSTR
jgi:hypothetical protein